jgi:hypothetical protein
VAKGTNRSTLNDLILCLQPMWSERQGKTKGAGHSDSFSIIDASRRNQEQEVDMSKGFSNERNLGRCSTMIKLLARDHCYEYCYAHVMALKREDLQCAIREKSDMIITLLRHYDDFIETIELRLESQPQRVSFWCW